MNNLKKAIAGALTLFTLSIGAVPAFAQEGVEQEQKPELTFEEMQAHALEKIEKAIERISDHSEKVQENEDIDEEKKAEIAERLTERLANLAEQQTKIQAAGSVEDMQALREAARAERFENQKVRMIERFNKVVQHLTEKFETVQNNEELSDEEKEEKIARITGKIEKIGEHAEQVQNAESREDLPKRAHGKKGRRGGEDRQDRQGRRGGEDRQDRQGRRGGEDRQDRRGGEDRFSSLGSLNEFFNQ